MKKYVIIFVAILVIAMLIIAGTSLGGGTDYWKTDVAFGEIREYIEVEFEDGTTEQLKIIADQKNSIFPLSSVYYDGKKVKRFQYIMTAVAEGGRYTKVDIDPYLKFEKKIVSSGGSVKWKETVIENNAITGNINEEIKILSTGIPIKTLAGENNWEGDYKCFMAFYGTSYIKYRGYGGGQEGEWKEVTGIDLNPSGGRQWVVTIVKDDNGNGGEYWIELKIDEDWIIKYE